MLLALHGQHYSIFANKHFEFRKFFCGAIKLHENLINPTNATKLRGSLTSFYDH